MKKTLAATIARVPLGTAKRGVRLGTIRVIAPTVGLPRRRDLPPYRSRTRFTALRSRRPIDRHFSWQHVPTLNPFPEKQSREVALRVHENQMTTAHLCGGSEYLLKGAARRPQRYKVRLVNHAGQSTPGDQPCEPWRGVGSPRKE
jgi:hypothetical protein